MCKCLPARESRTTHAGMRLEKRISHEALLVLRANEQGSMSSAL